MFVRPNHRPSPLSFHTPISWTPLLTTTALFSIITALVVVALDSRRPGAMPAPTAEATPSPAAAVYESPLKLKVSSQKQHIEIRWDHEASVIQKADKGLIKITEGEMSELIPLDRRELQDGYVAYTAMTNDVRIRLEIIASDGKSISESARVVAIP
jgi:hypothetical protein